MLFSSPPSQQGRCLTLVLRDQNPQTDTDGCTDTVPWGLPVFLFSSLAINNK